MAQTSGHQLFQRVLPECNAAPASDCCAFSDERTEPIAPDQLTRTLIAPAIGATVIADCLLPANDLVIVNTVPFSTHCDQI
jgi:hypothetical protein